MRENSSEYLRKKMQIDPKTILEVSIEPNSCFKIIGVEDGVKFLYIGTKGMVKCYYGTKATDKLIELIASRVG